MAFASQLQPSVSLPAPEVSGMGIRAPGSLPGLMRHYPPPHPPPLPHPHPLSHSHCSDRSAVSSGMRGESQAIAASSPSSSEESSSPLEAHSYRRLGDRAPLIKRLAFGFGAALLQPSDDDSTPLVPDTPTTPTNVPLCLNGYINEASEAETRTRVPSSDARHHTSHHLESHALLKHCNNLRNGSPSTSTSTSTSTPSSVSSGGSSCGAGPGGGSASCGSASCGSGNNNVPRPEPGLRHAPWFQAGIPREIALEVLSNQPVGAFMVRCSTTQTGCYALSVRVPRDFHQTGIAHYLIQHAPKGYKIKGFTKEFTSLSALVTHHSVMPELLPCPLRLARPPAHPATAAPAPHHPPHHADFDMLPQRAPPPPHHRAAHNFLAQLDV